MPFPRVSSPLTGLLGSLVPAGSTQTITIAAG